MSSAGSELRRRTLHSLGWQLLGVGGQRVVQLAGPMCLARLIPNENEIGLFVVLLMGIGIVEALTMFVGEQTTMSSQSDVDRRYLDTVFTVRVLRGFVISGVLCGLAWPLAAFFATPETTALYWLPGLFLALAPNALLDAFQSPARAARMKGLDFRRIVLGDFLAAVLGTGVTILLAFLWGNVWAMLVGHLSMTAIKSAVSYLSAPHMPRFTLHRPVLKELLHYNLGALGAPFLLLLIQAAPAVVLGKVLRSTGALAIFDFAGRIARLPEDIFLRVVAPVAIPAYAQLQNDRERLGRAWLQAVHAFMLVGGPLTAAMAWTGKALPYVLFGPKYGSIEGLFVLQSIHGGMAGLLSVVGPLFWGVGKPQLDRNAQLLRSIGMYSIGIPAAIYYGVNGFAAAACVAIALGLLLALHYALRHLQLPLSKFLRSARDG
ncbi:MAG: oligosaccharide flippase family protein, partial [Planctomycetota bacterium]